MTTIRSAGRMASALAVLIVVVLAAYYFTLLPVGDIQINDEFRTFDRTLGFVESGDYLTVQAYNQPTFRKPPLQYWMSAALIARGVDLVAALRFPSWLFTILTLATTGFLAHTLRPRSAFAAPAAIALLAGSEAFWMFGISAMLDAGAMAFATVAVTACLLALRQPRWWYLVAAAIGLAAMQKAPIPLALVAVMVLVATATARQTGIDLRGAFANRHFVLAGLVMTAMLLAWPAIQWLRHGTEALAEAYGVEMVNRFSPFSGVRRGPGQPLAKLVFDGEYILRVPGLLALAALPFLLGRRELLALPLMVVAYAVMAAVAGGSLYPRYFLVFLPLLMAALAVVIVDGLARWPIAALAVVVALSFSLSGPFRTSAGLGHLREGPMALRPFLEEVGRALRDDETLVACQGRGSPHVGLVSQFASNGRPFLRLQEFGALERLERQGRARPPYRGVCKAAEADTVRRRFGENAIMGEFNGAIHWQSRVGD